MNNELMLDVGQANEFKLACRREGLTNEDIKVLCERKGFLADVRNVLLNRSEIKMVSHLIDCDAQVYVPDGWSVLPDKEQLPNRVRGQFTFDSSKVRLHIDDGQKNWKYLIGDKLRENLKDKPVYTAHVLDYLLAHPHLIPEEWKGKYVFFWGTIYRGGYGDLCVRCLYWDGGRWNWSSLWLDGDFGGVYPAALRAS